LFEAVRTGLLPLRRSRLSQREREGLAAGQVFVWVESTEADGLERWTDGRKWSASRTRDVFLVYEERDEPSLDESLQKASRKIKSSYPVQSASLSGEHFGIFAFPRDRQPKPGGLIKQTFSAWVDDSRRARTKWHLSAYLDRTGGSELHKVREDALLSRITVPEGVYECCTGPRRHRKISSPPTPSERSPRVSHARSIEVDSIPNSYVLSPMTSPSYPTHPPLPRITFHSEMPHSLPSPAYTSPSLSPLHMSMQLPDAKWQKFDFHEEPYRHSFTDESSSTSIRAISPVSDDAYDKVLVPCHDPAKPVPNPKDPAHIDSASPMILFRRLPPPVYPTVYNSRSPLDCRSLSSFPLLK